MHLFLLLFILQGFLYLFNISCIIRIDFTCMLSVKQLSESREEKHETFYKQFFFLRIRPIGLFQFRIISEIMNHRHMVGLPGRVISSSQGLYLHMTTQHRNTRTNFHALSGIRTCDPVYERSRPAPQIARPLDWPNNFFFY
jgi:hypothetical protein